jgi:TolB protein
MTVNPSRNLRVQSFAMVLASGLLLLAAVAWPTSSSSQEAATNDQPLPTRMVIDVTGAERALYRIAVPQLLGNPTAGAEGAEVIRNDLKLVSLFQVLDPKGFLANLEQEGLTYVEAPWSAVGAQGVVKGQISGGGSSMHIEMRFYEVARGANPVLQKTYNGGQGQLRGFMHDFANEILRVLTGKAGSFGTRLLFARKGGAGRKDIYIADFDGKNEGRVSKGKGIAVLPSFGMGKIWYSMVTELGTFITNTAAAERPVINADGINMGVSVCGSRAYFSSTRDGNSEIYSSNLDGSGVTRLTNNPAIDVSPTCGPGNQIAFVSARHGGPQVFLMSTNGGDPKRITYKGSHNQTPAFCRDANNPMVAFSGRDGGGWDIFTVSLKTGAYTRLTQGQGVNQDPAFSPDCRMVAFASSRGGIFLSNPEGLNQNLVIKGSASTVRWGQSVPKP